MSDTEREKLKALELKLRAMSDNLGWLADECGRIDDAPLPTLREVQEIYAQAATDEYLKTL